LGQNDTNIKMTTQVLLFGKYSSAGLHYLH